MWIDLEDCLQQVTVSLPEEVDDLHRLHGDPVTIRWVFNVSVGVSHRSLSEPISAPAQSRLARDLCVVGRAFRC